ncbi:MAG: hypothetical protein WBD36_08870 [Bacteroidota bacterium]
MNKSIDSQSSSLAIARKAATILKAMQQQSAAENSQKADELLLFFYDLNDHYRLIQSKSPRFSGTLPNILKEIIYLLESSPDSAFQNDTWMKFMLNFLEDLSTGKVIVGLRS